MVDVIVCRGQVTAEGFPGRRHWKGIKTSTHIKGKPRSQELIAQGKSVGLS